MVNILLFGEIKESEQLFAGAVWLNMGHLVYAAFIFCHLFVIYLYVWLYISISGVYDSYTIMPCMQMYCVVILYCLFVAFRAYIGLFFLSHNLLTKMAAL